MLHSLPACAALPYLSNTADRPAVAPLSARAFGVCLPGLAAISAAAATASIAAIVPDDAADTVVGGLVCVCVLLLLLLACASISA